MKRARLFLAICAGLAWNASVRSAQTPATADAKAAPGSATAQQEQRGRALLTRVLRGMGDEKRLDRLTSYEHSETAVVTTSGGELCVRSEWRVEFPERVREDITNGGSTTTRVFQPGASFEVQGGRVQSVSEQRRREWMSSMIYQPFWLLRQRNARGFRVAARANVVEVEYEGQRMTVALEAKNDQIRSISYRERGWSANRIGVFEWRFADYRSVDGLKFPFRHEIYFDGQLQISAKLDSLVVNRKFDAKVFERPA